MSTTAAATRPSEKVILRLLLIGGPPFPVLEAGEPDGDGGLTVVELVELDFASGCLVAAGAAGDGPDGVAGVASRYAGDRQLTAGELAPAVTALEAVPGI